ncbi:MAG: O-methyltransferase [Flavobacteriales bacterium]|nr:O-methyltransferase [Flavobacteriales bacterium]MBP9080935.1 O-methyltransferase [Flavobacteriales bacterium]
MQFLDPALDAYCETQSGPEPAYLTELTAETQEKVHMPQMLSGHLQGRFLAMLSRLVQPRTIVEIGTYTGYSALCLAEGLAKGGMLHTIDIDPYLPEMVHRYLEKAGMTDRITMHHRPALEVIPTIPAPFDLVFIDADKQNYPDYFGAVIGNMRPGGLIIADNVLWSGKVLGARAEQDDQTRALVEYARRVNTDPRVEPVLVPLRDGLLLARVKA